MSNAATVQQLQCTRVNCCRAGVGVDACQNECSGAAITVDQDIRPGATVGQNTGQGRIVRRGRICDNIDLGRIAIEVDIIGKKYRICRRG